MRVILFALSVLSIITIKYTSADPVTCQALHDKCRPASKNLDPTHPESCGECIDACKQALKVCAADKGNNKSKEHFEWVKGYLLYCVNACPKNSKNE